MNSDGLERAAPDEARRQTFWASVLDYATKWPDAFAKQTTDSTNIAEKVTQMFT